MVVLTPSFGFKAVLKNGKIVGRLQEKQVSDEMAAEKNETKKTSGKRLRR